MNRRVVLGLVCLMTVFATVAGASPNTFNGLPVVNVSVNGKAVASDVPAVIMNGRTVLPVRAIADAIGAVVQWDESSYTVSLTVTAAEDVAKLQEKNISLATELATMRAETNRLRTELKAAQNEMARLKTQVTVTPPLQKPQELTTTTPSAELKKFVAEAQALGYDVQYAEQDEGQHYRLTDLWNYVQVGIKSDAVPPTGNFDIGVAMPVLQKLMPLMQKHFPKSEVWIVFLFNQSGGRYSRCEMSIPAINIGGCSGGQNGGIFEGGAKNRWVRP